MKTEKILQIIHDIDMDGIKHVEMPVQHLIQLRKEIQVLRGKLSHREKQLSQSIADGLKILSRDIKVKRFDDYA